MTANLTMFLDTKDFILLGRTAHVFSSADFVNLAYAHCLTTVMRADVSCFEEIANAINLVRLKSCCKSDVMHAAGLQVCHIHGSSVCLLHMKLPCVMYAKAFYGTGAIMSLIILGRLWR